MQCLSLLLRADNCPGIVQGFFYALMYCDTGSLTPWPILMDGQALRMDLDNGKWAAVFLCPQVLNYSQNEQEK